MLTARSVFLTAIWPEPLSGSRPPWSFDPKAVPAPAHALRVCGRPDCPSHGHRPRLPQSRPPSSAVANDTRDWALRHAAARLY